MSAPSGASPNSDLRVAVVITTTAPLRSTVYFYRWDYYRAHGDFDAFIPQYSYLVLSFLPFVEPLEFILPTPDSAKNNILMFIRIFAADHYSNHGNTH